MRHIGVDLHKTNFVVCFIEADDTQQIETYPLTRDGLARFTRQLNAQDEVAVEATQNVHYFYDQVRAHVSRVAVVDTYRFGVVAKSKKKTDKADAAALARFLKLGLLPEVPVPSEQVRTEGCGQGHLRDGQKALNDHLRAVEEGTRLLVPGGQTLQSQATGAQCCGLSVDFA
jgi:transposase